MSLRADSFFNHPEKKSERETTTTKITQPKIKDFKSIFRKKKKKIIPLNKTVENSRRKFVFIRPRRMASYNYYRLGLNIRWHHHRF